MFCPHYCNSYPPPGLKLHLTSVAPKLLNLETSRNFLITRFMKETLYVFSFTFFLLPLIFTLHWCRWPLAFLILSSLLQNFHVVLPTKTCLFCFLSLALDFCRPFSRWALACRILSFFLCLSLALYSKFVDMTITPSLILEKTRIPRHIVAFRFRLHWLFSCLCFTRRGWLCDFPSK